MITFKKGSVWICELPILKGKQRPCVIISDDIFNRDPKTNVVNVIPLSTSLDMSVDSVKHLQMKIIADKLCQPLVEYVYPCDKGDIVKFIGILDDEELSAIETAFFNHFTKQATNEVVVEKLAVEVKSEEKKEVYKIGQIKYTDEEKLKVVQTYDKAINDKDKNMRQRLADVYAKGDLKKLADNVRYYRKCLKKKGLTV